MGKSSDRSRELSAVARQLVMRSRGLEFEKESTSDCSSFFGGSTYDYCMEFKLSSLNWYFFR
jgi:hypothetical protein